MLISARRRFLLGAAAFLAAPAIVRVANIMPISVIKQEGFAVLCNAGMETEPALAVGTMWTDGLSWRVYDGFVWQVMLRAGTAQCDISHVSAGQSQQVVT